MDIPSIETFLMVAKTGSFSHAAEALYLTQPAVSKRISALESELNYQLFDRVKKHIVLTEAGKIFLPRAQTIIAELKDSKNALAKMKDVVAGEFLMFTSHHIGLHYLPPVLKQYVHAYPQVDLHLDFMESEAACLAVEKAEIELAVITLPNHPAPCLKLEKIWSDPLSIAINKDHQILSSHLSGYNHQYDHQNTQIIITRDELQQLSHYPAILPDKGTFTRELVDQFLAHFNINVQEKLSNNYLETIKMMVGVGLGWSVLPDTLIDQSLVKLVIKGFNAGRLLGIVSHKDRTLSQAALKMNQLIINAKH